MQYCGTFNGWGKHRHDDSLKIFKLLLDVIRSACVCISRWVFKKKKDFFLKNEILLPVFPRWSSGAVRILASGQAPPGKMEEL